MQLYVDSGDLDEVARLDQWLPLTGITLNPTLVSRTGRPLFALLEEISERFPRKSVHVQVVSKQAEKMVEQAESLHSSAPAKVFVKLPATRQGMQAISRLRQNNEEIKLTATAVYNAGQALAAASHGVDFIAPYISRIDREGNSGMDLCREIKRMLDNYGFSAGIIAASVKNGLQVKKLAGLQVKAMTLSPEIYRESFTSQLTERDEENFLADWYDVFSGYRLNAEISNQE